MNDYVIQKPRFHGFEPAGDRDWVNAWPYPRGYIRASSDDEAIAVFTKETAKVRKVPHRLVAYSTWGYDAEVRVLATTTQVSQIPAPEGDAAGAEEPEEPSS